LVINHPLAMNNIILFDDPSIRTQLLPFTFTRPVAAIRCGILTVAEKWNKALQSKASFQTADYLSAKFPTQTNPGTQLYINGALCPDDPIIDAIEKLPLESALLSDQQDVLAIHTTSDWTPSKGLSQFESRRHSIPFVMIRSNCDIFAENGNQIKVDFDRLTTGRTSQPINDPHTACYNSNQIFIEEGAVIKAAIINAETGPVYIGKDAVIGEGSSIQGPFGMMEGAVLAQGTKIRPNTTIGPFSKMGGEVNNCVVFGYSNKGHDGYLGNAVLGEWCNLGANTNNSNLKNDFSNVKLYNYATDTLEDTGRTLCGLFMGDYSKAGISTMFNTGTVVGVNVNVFGAGFQPKHIPSFSWGGKAEGFSTYRLEKALTVAYETVKRRNIPFGDPETAILQHIFDQTANKRI
jgi:UDP-N-acetylglucosamine diphosphorylase/glucosamine-1-phosphate N-acetyltransferase